jgi:hypothetical protein
VFVSTTFAGAHLERVDLTNFGAPGANFEMAYCDWQTKVPEGWACSGTVLERKQPRCPAIQQFRRSTAHVVGLRF